MDRGVLVARSADGGLRWDTPVTLIRDQVTGPNRGFSDRSAVTADPTDSQYAYVVWQWSTPDPDGVQRIPTWFARTTDGGHTWERPRPIYDPGPGRQTYANQIAVLPDGTLVNLLSEVAVRPDATSAEVKVMRSTDHGRPGRRRSSPGTSGSGRSPTRSTAPRPLVSRSRRTSPSTHGRDGRAST